MRLRMALQNPRLFAQPSKRGANGGKGVVQRRPNDRRFAKGHVEVLLVRAAAGAITESQLGDDELMILHGLFPLRVVIGAVTPMTEE
jgi:hypothetical protein